MANGDIILQTRECLQVKLLDTLAGTDNGVWIDVALWNSAGVDITASGTLTIDLMASNAATKPANATDGAIIRTITNPSAATFVPVVGASGNLWLVMPRWIKAKCSAYTGGSPSAIMIARAA